MFFRVGVAVADAFRAWCEVSLAEVCRVVGGECRMGDFLQANLRGVSLLMRRWDVEEREVLSC